MAVVQKKRMGLSENRRDLKAEWDYYSKYGKGRWRGRSSGLKTGESVTIGRAAGRAQFALPHDTFMSGVHFAVECGASGCRVQDRKSSNGTLPEWREAFQDAMLANGDEIKGGQTIFKVKIVADAKLASMLPSQEVAPPATPQPRPRAAEPVAPPAASPPRPRGPESTPPAVAPQPRQGAVDPLRLLVAATTASETSLRPLQSRALVLQNLRSHRRQTFRRASHNRPRKLRRRALRKLLVLKSQRFASFLNCDLPLSRMLIWRTATNRVRRGMQA